MASRSEHSTSMIGSDLSETMMKNDASSMQIARFRTEVCVIEPLFDAVNPSSLNKNEDEDKDKDDVDDIDFDDDKIEDEDDDLFVDDDDEDDFDEKNDKDVLVDADDIN